MLNKDVIMKCLTVRVNEASGVVVSPIEKDILYVFTCKHVIDNGKEIKVRYDSSSTYGEEVTFEFDDYILSDDEHSDVAIIVVKRIDEELPHLYVSRDKVNCYHVGFPSCRENANEKYQNIRCTDISNFDGNDESSYIEYQYTFPPRNSELKGTSGGGIFNEKGFLIGIHTQSAMSDQIEMLGKGVMIPVSHYLNLISKKGLSPVYKYDLQQFGEMVSWVFDFSKETFIDNRLAQFYADVDGYKEIVEKWSPIRIFRVLYEKEKIKKGTRLESLDKDYWKGFTLFVVGIIACLDLKEIDGEKVILELYEKFHYCYSDEEMDVFDVRDKLDSQHIVRKTKGAKLIVGGLNKTVFNGCFAPPSVQVPDIAKAEIIEENDIARSRNNVFNQMMIINNNIFEQAVRECANDMPGISIAHYRDKLNDVIN